MEQLDKIKTDYLKKVRDLVEKWPEDEKGYYVGTVGYYYGKRNIYCHVQDDSLINFHGNNSCFKLYDLVPDNGEILAVLSGYGPIEEMLVPIQALSCSVICKIYNSLKRGYDNLTK